MREKDTNLSHPRLREEIQVVTDERRMWYREAAERWDHSSFEDTSLRAEEKSGYSELHISPTQPAPSLHSIMSCSPCSQQPLCCSSNVLPPQGICTCWSPRNVHPPAPTLLVLKSLLVRPSLNILFKSVPALLTLSCFVVLHNTNHCLTSYFTYFFFIVCLPTLEYDLPENLYSVCPLISSQHLEQSPV